MRKKKLWIGLGILAVLAITATVFVLLNGKALWGKDSKKETNDTQSEESEGTENEEASGPVTIWIMGDSLAAENRRNPDSEGWGAMLEQYFKEDVTVRNSAAGGASASSYIQNGTCKMVLDSLEKGDYVIIQFGHNDVWYEDRLTDPYGSSEEEGSFKYLLKNEYIKPIIEKGAHPILATSVVSCAYDGNGELYEMLYADHAQAMRDLVKECAKEGIDIPLVDTYAITDRLYRELGEDEAQKFHSDQVHYNNYGAAYVAGLIVEELKKAGLEFCQNVYTFEEVVEASEKLQEEMSELGVAY